MSFCEPSLRLWGAMHAGYAASAHGLESLGCGIHVPIIDSIQKQRADFHVAFFSAVHDFTSLFQRYLSLRLGLSTFAGFSVSPRRVHGRRGLFCSWRTRSVDLSLCHAGACCNGSGNGKVSRLETKGQKGQGILPYFFQLVCCIYWLHTFFWKQKVFCILIF